MIRAYAVSSVREAEARFTSAAPAGIQESELMARAADGLAVVAAERLGGVGGRRVVGGIGCAP